MFQPLIFRGVKGETGAETLLKQNLTKSFRYLQKNVLNPSRQIWGLVFPYIGLTYSLCNIGEYLYFRYLKCLDEKQGKWYMIIAYNILIEWEFKKRTAVTS